MCTVIKLCNFLNYNIDRVKNWLKLIILITKGSFYLFRYFKYNFFIYSVLFFPSSYFSFKYKLLLRTTMKFHIPLLNITRTKFLFCTLVHKLKIFKKRSILQYRCYVQLQSRIIFNKHIYILELRNMFLMITLRQKVINHETCKKTNYPGGNYP